MIDETTIQFLRDFGFPMFVVLWFMFRTEKILKQNTRAIEKFTEALIGLNCPYIRKVKGGVKHGK